MKCNSSFLKRFSFIKLLFENLGRKCNLNLQLQAAMAHHKQDGVENKSGSTEKSQNRFQNDGILFLAHKIGNYLLIQSENGYKKYSRNESTKWKTLLRKYKIKANKNCQRERICITKSSRQSSNDNQCIKQDTKRNQTPPSAYEREFK
ncbi:hypothetical protein T02_5762 [Trichinella nativa]|uniref:Uncharacterized protein n=1 Tax=Trichinella nativa TaxID=6335 RepID=A0A0V1LS10_9BILA|nr:hypothetical protein T02_5762 [Trichinella nativa]